MKLLTIIIFSLLIVSPAYARGFSSGGHSSFSSGSNHSSQSSGHTTSYSKPSFSSSAPKVSSSKPVINGYSTTGFKVTSGNQPTFAHGYTPPTGSVVYNRSFNIVDLLFWSYIFSHNGQQQVVVQQPDGQKVQTSDPNQIDWMYYVDWVIIILLAIGLIVLIVWFVNKHTQPKGDLNYASV